tara:strand:- start:1685 stop:1870 length:186 start_codon:yes stop_codon:yes gene_type:complete
MAGEKIDVTFSINGDMEEMLKEAAEKYKLPDTSKALRVVLDYVIQDGDWEEVFAKIRCDRC